MDIKIIAVQIFAFLFSHLAMAGLPEGVRTYKDQIYISAAPSQQNFSEMKKIGVKVVIDLREPEELKGFEKKAAKESGIAYFSAPISRTGEIQGSQIAAVEKVLDTNKDKKVWVYCHSSNRAASWMAIHLVKSNGMPVDDALTEARALGLSKADMETKVRAFLKSK